MQLSFLRNTQHILFNKFWQAGEVLRDFIRKIITILYFIHCPLGIVLNKAARFIVGQIRSFPCSKLSLQGRNKSFPWSTRPYSKCPSLPLTSSTLPLTHPILAPLVHPTSGPLQQPCPQLSPLFPQISAWVTPWPPSSLFKNLLPRKAYPDPCR